MTHCEIARALGISRTLVQIIERRALNKLAVLIGVKPKHPKWMRRHERVSIKGPYRCGRCGERGHNVRACLSAA